MIHVSRSIENHKKASNFVAFLAFYHFLRKLKHRLLKSSDRAVLNFRSRFIAAIMRETCAGWPSDETRRPFATCASTREIDAFDVPPRERRFSSAISRIGGIEIRVRGNWARRHRCPGWRGLSSDSSLSHSSAYSARLFQIDLNSACYCRRRADSFTAKRASGKSARSNIRSLLSRNTLARDTPDDLQFYASA